MNTLRIQHILACVALALGGQAHALVEAGHWGSDATPGTGSSLDLYTTIDQTPDGDYTGIFSNYANGVLTGISYNLDQGSDLFVVQKGAIFSNETVLTQSLPFIMGVSVEWGAIPQIATVGQEFYLGARTRTDSFANGYFDTFGWAHFKVDATGQLNLLDSAVAFKEGGIIVGTLQAVPEPSSVLMAGLGLAGLLWRAHARAKPAASSKM